MSPCLRVRIWDENTVGPGGPYPAGIRAAVAEALVTRGESDWRIACAHLDEPAQGLADGDLDHSDVLVWWGHARHQELAADRVRAVVERIHAGRLGFVALHSAHYSQPFKLALACSGDLGGGWDEAGGPERIRVCAPDHPIARGVIDFTLPAEEMYGAPFHVPPPECTVLQSSFPAHGKHFPCCLCWTVGRGKDPAFMDTATRSQGEGRGAGRLVYLRPGHETLPSLRDPSVQQVLANAVRWCGPDRKP